MITNEKYEVGSQVWNRISRNKEIWRIGEITKIENDSYEGITVRQPNTKTTRYIYNYQSYNYELMPRAVVPHVPKDTIYLIDTNMGDSLSRRLNNDERFDVFECNTKAMSMGKLLGYLIVPGAIYELEKWHTKPGYKNWLIGPSVHELLSFLGTHLQEILAVRKSLIGLTNVQEPKTEINTF